MPVEVVDLSEAPAVFIGLAALGLLPSDSVLARQNVLMVVVVVVVREPVRGHTDARDARDGKRGAETDQGHARRRHGWLVDGHSWKV